MRPSSIVRRYAEAAYDVATEDSNVDEWLTQLAAGAGRTEKEREIREYFRDPNYSHEEKLGALEVLFGDLQPHVLNLLRELVTHQRFHLLPQIHDEFAGLEREARGVTEAYVTVAREASDDERSLISRELGSSLGKEVELHLSVDPTLLGGIVVRIGDQVYDASVATRLQRLRQELAV
jgi:F-type H+-transporting ATPase subunit delta